MNWCTISFSVILFLLSPKIFAQGTEQKPFPADTSYSTYSAWLKIRKEFPKAKIVEPQIPDGVVAEYDLVYNSLKDATYGNRDMHFDLFSPASPGKYPALILVHGGGWSSGNKRMQVPLAQQIAYHGYVTACIEYRLSPEALYPAAVYDINTAIRFLRTHAEKYNIDPERIAISGSSAGGQLAALVGMTGDLEKFNENKGDIVISTIVKAIIDMDGILDFTDPNESEKDNDPAKPSAGAKWFGATFSEAPGKWIEASPLTYAGKDTPPILFLNSSQPRYHAGRDSLIKALAPHGIYTEIHTLSGSPHTFWLFHPWFEPTVSYIVGFLDKMLK